MPPGPHTRAGGSNPPPSPSNPLRTLLIYLAFVFLGGALLAPCLYWAAGAIPSLEHFTTKPFHRFVNRAVLGLALLGLYPLLNNLGANSWSAVGLTWRPGWKQLAKGALLGFLSLAAVALIALAADARGLQTRHTLATVLSRIGTAALSAVIVALLEELLFRGSFFGLLRRTHHWCLALLVSSGIYSIVHFFRKPPQPETITWLTGFTTLGSMLGGLVHLPSLIPAFLTLMVAGSMLALAYHRTGNLYFSIGLHAGWIFWLKCYGFLTFTHPDTHIGFWGTNKLIDGWVAFFVLTPLLLLLWTLPPRVQPAPSLD